MSDKQTINAAEVFERLASGQPTLIFWNVLESHADKAHACWLVATEFEEVSWSLLEQIRPAGPASGNAEFYFGIAAYDDYAGGETTTSLSRLFRVSGIRKLQRTSSDLFFNDSPLALIPQRDAADFLGIVADAIEQIRNGEFYQVNLLRYFSARFDDRSPDLLGALFSRWLKYAGQCGAWVWLPDLKIASFSPERFVRLDVREQNFVCSTWPIKGTRARGENEAEDSILRRELETSEKEHSELNMIVDLMRNDLNRICKLGTVQVVDSGRMAKLPHVYHRIACVEGHLDTSLSVGEILRRILPGGSVTGAPKRAAMQAILQLECRRRDFFMGTCLVFRPGEFFDSSILIRTLVNGEFAAGSGIVLRSNPKQELDEVAAKAKTVGTIV